MNREYDLEFLDNSGRKYGYSFDFDIMQNYMIKSFLPYINSDDLLELGSFKGDFTMKLQNIFSNITCIEASGVAIEEAREKLPKSVELIHGTFETISLNRKFNNIVMTHVLEHLDDPVFVLEKINNEWLSDAGKLFLVCPNANAPSRQIAVKMGLIEHNASVTDAEKLHGHRITYSFDTLERDVRKSGLRIVLRSGIFFKALANFQWDKILQADIVSKEYLDGCYELGQKYPDLCASIFLLCEKS